MADVPESITVSDTGFALPTSEILTGRGFITGKSGSGKSVLEGTIVYTDHGRKPIEEVVRGEKVLSLNTSDSQQEFREVLATIEHEADNLLRITLEDGTELVGTEDHSFLTVENREIVPIRGDQVTAGTWFPLARELPSAGSITRIDLADYAADARDPDRTPPTGPGTAERFLDLGVDAGTVLGLYLADGSVDGRSTVEIATDDDDVKGFLATQGFEVSDRTCSRSFRPFGRFVAAEFGRRSTGTSLPDWVFDAPEAFKAGLLSGYLDGAGAIEDTVSVTATSTDLIGGIKELLRHFGVASTVREPVGAEGEERRAMRLRVDAFCLDRLQEAVELRVSEKAEALGRAVAATDAGDPSTATAVGAWVGSGPDDGARGPAGTRRAQGHRRPAASTQLLAGGQPAGRATVTRFDDAVGGEGWAAQVGRSDVHWVRVVEVEALEASHTVYDLDVRLNDNFIANGVFVHNSNTASVIAEELLEHSLPMLIVDTDGEYFGLKTRYELLHVGADADCDATVGVEHAEKLAELALLQNVPVILDVSGFVEESERRELVRRVVERLFERGKQVRKPFLVFVEEIHEFLPQSGGTDDLANMLITVAKRGRKRGIGLCGMSQRPAAVDKDYITQCDWVVWHRLTWDNDKRVASQMLGSDIARGIDDLDAGEGLLMTDWDDRINRIRFRRKRTFDAGATPGLDDIDGGGYSPVRTALISELSDDEADINDIEVDELPGATEFPDDAAGGDLDPAADAGPGSGEAGATTLEAAPVQDPGTDVVTIPSRPSARPSYTPPEPAEDEPFDPVWELGHLTVYLVSRLAGSVVSLVVGTGRAIVALGRDAGRASRWVEHRLRRDAERTGRAVCRRVVRPAVRELEDIAAYGISDRLIVGAVITLLAIAIVLLLVG